MALKPYTIVFSNYTGQLFAWPGSPAEVRKYLANREAIGAVNASNEDDALRLWRARTI